MLSKIFIFLCVLLSANTMANAQEYNTDDSKIALSGFSPVSYIELQLAQRGKAAYRTEYRGLKYYFTNAEQKSRFVANPEKYLPKYGGWCATGIAAGAKFRVDPHKFIVENGELLLFLYDLEVDAKELWQADPTEMHKKAESNWKKMTM